MEPRGGTRYAAASRWCHWLPATGYSLIASGRHACEHLRLGGSGGAAGGAMASVYRQPAADVVIVGGGGHLTLIEDEALLPAFAESVTRQQAAGLDIRLADAHDLAQIMPGVATTVVAGSYSPEDGHANPILTTKAFADAAVRAGARLL